MKKTRSLSIRTMIFLLAAGGLLAISLLLYGFSEASYPAARSAPPLARPVASPLLTVDRVEGGSVVVEDADGVCHSVPIRLPPFHSIREGDVFWVVVYVDRSARQRRLTRAQALIAELKSRSSP